MINQQKVSIEELYKEFQFFLYLLGQIIRKKKLDLINSEEYEHLLNNLKSNINNCLNELKKQSSKQLCPLCNENIGNKSFYMCENCYSIFHQDHIKHNTPEIICNNCKSSLYRIKILSHNICLSDFNTTLEKIKVSKISLFF
ncbi:MAG: hypothetical protein EAX96_01300 [Candidatus Lokiarchaeota archaeon]|nr:hypothetical protein [Candidatus Lokiarchaeota archaeon]